MENSIFGSFEDKSNFIESVSKVNNYLSFYFENSRFPDEGISLSNFLTQILPSLTKYASNHIQGKSITNDLFFQQIKILIGFYIKLIQKDNINVSSLLLQILLSIYIYFPNFLKNDTYNFTDCLTLNVITYFFSLTSENADYVDFLILILLIIFIQNENIGAIEDSEFLFKYIEKFDQCIDTFNYSKSDSTIFSRIFWLFAQILDTFPYFSQNSSDEPNFFNSFMNFSIKSLQSCQSIDKQKASIQFINSVIKNDKYNLDSKSGKINANNALNTDKFNNFDYMSNFVDNVSSKSDSLDIVDDFSITNENVNKNPLFVLWSQKFNPLIALINVEGHRDTLQEVDIIIQKICMIYENTDIIADQITPEIIHTIANRIESADISQKRIFVHEFVCIFSSLCSVSDQFVIEFLQKVRLNDAQKKSPQETDGNDNDSNIIISSSTLFELGKELISNQTIFQYILEIFEKQIYEENDSSAITYVIQLIKSSNHHINRQLTRCLDILKTESDPPDVIYEMLRSMIAELNKDHLDQLFSELIVLSEMRNSKNFCDLLEKVTIKCRKQPTKQELILLIQKFCTDDDGWKAMKSIITSRKVNMLGSSSWEFLIEIFCQTKMSAASLDFIETIFPSLIKAAPYENNSNSYNFIYIHLMNDYIQYGNYQCFEAFIQIEAYLSDICKTYMYKMLIQNKMAEMTSNPKMENNNRALDFFRMLIERKEWNMNFSQFKKRKVIKEFKRLKPLKKPSNRFTIKVSCAMPDSTKFETHQIEVTPDTLINDIIIYFAIGIGFNSNCIEIHSLDENFYYANVKTDQMYNDLSRWDSIKELGINEKTDLRLFYNNGQDVKEYYFIDFFPSEILSSKEIQKFLIKTIKIEKESVLAKSAWKLLCLLRPEPSLLLTDMNGYKSSSYLVLYSYRMVPYILSEQPELFNSPDIGRQFASTVQDIVTQNMSGKLLNSALSALTFDKADIAISDGGVPLLNILIDSFVNSNRNTLNERILIVMNLAQCTHRINEFDSIVISNEKFLKKCALLNSSDSFTKKDIIFKFFNNFRVDSKKVLFEFYSKIFLHENCISILKATFTNDCEVTDLFNKCIKMIMDDNDNISNQYIEDLYSFINFILVKKSSLINETSSICPQLISKALEEMDNNIQSQIFGIILHYIKGSNSNQNAIDLLVQFFDSFESTEYNYDPSLQEKKSCFCGLKSLGMTCYMNSILQQLAHNKTFRNSLLKINDDQNNSLISELQKVVARLEYSVKSVVNTASFAQVWKEKCFPSFNPFNQEDVVEFFHCLLDHLPDNLQNIFTGEQVNAFEGISVPFTKTIAETFTSIEIPVSMTFPEAMRSVFSTSMFVGNNQYNSDEYGKIDAQMKSSISKFPNTFVIQLKRFKYTLKTQTRTKVSTIFKFPPRFNTKEIFENTDSDIEYVLKGVVSHSGTTDGGHYNSLIKIDGSWVLFNDNVVEILTDSKFNSLTQGEGGKNALQSCAYVLFYVSSNKKENGNNNDNIMEEEDDDDDDVIDNSMQNPFIDEINKENEAFKKMQCIFSQELASFAVGTQNIDIILPYFLNVFTHSTMLKSTSKTIQEINALLKDNKVKGFDFFFANSCSSENDELKKDENLSKTIDVLLNGQDELVQPFIFLLRHLIQEKSKSYGENSEDREEKIKKDEIVLLILLNNARKNAKSWNSLERFGNVSNAFCEFYNNLFVNQEIKPQICHKIIEIISIFYEEIKTGLSLKNADFTSYFKSLIILNSSIENIDVFEKFITKIKPKMNSNKNNSNSFAQFVTAISNRKDKTESQNKPLKNEEPTQNKAESSVVVANENGGDDLGPFDIVQELKKVNRFLANYENVIFKYVDCFNPEVDIVNILNLVDPDDSETMLSILTSFNFNFTYIYQLFTIPQYSIQKTFFVQIMNQKPLILARLSFIPDFKSIMDQLFQYIFPNINFTYQMSSQLTDKSLVDRVIRFMIDSCKMIVRMKDYPWPFEGMQILLFKEFSMYCAIKDHITQKQKDEFYPAYEQAFLSCTPYVDIHKDDRYSSTGYFHTAAVERRKVITLCQMNFMYIYQCFDTKFNISTLEKYSEYYIRYGMFIPLEGYEGFDFVLPTIFKAAFEAKPELFIRVLKSEEILYPLEHSPKSQDFVRIIDLLAKNKEVCKCVILELMPKIPLKAVLIGTFLKIAVAHADILLSAQDKAHFLISSFVEQFFTNVQKIIDKNRFFSSMIDISKIVQNFGLNRERSIPVFDLSEKIEKGFIKDFLNVLGQGKFNDDASKFVTSLSSQNEEFADFALKVIVSILNAKSIENKASLEINKIAVKSNVMSTENCWKLISMIIEFSKGIENSILTVAKLVESLLTESDGFNKKECEYCQICIEKMALLINDSNFTKFRGLFNTILSSSIQISEHISPFLIEIIKRLDDSEKMDLILGTVVFMDIEEKEMFMHAFKVIVILLQNLQDRNSIINELNQTFPEIMELMDFWPEECNQKKYLFQL